MNGIGGPRPKNVDTPVTTLAALMVLTGTGAVLGQQGGGLELVASPMLSQWLMSGTSSNSSNCHIYLLPHSTRTSILSYAVIPLGLSSHLG